MSFEGTPNFHQPANSLGGRQYLSLKTSQNLP